MMAVQEGDRGREARREGRGESVVEEKVLTYAIASGDL